MIRSVCNLGLGFIVLFLGIVGIAMGENAKLYGSFTLDEGVAKITRSTETIEVKQASKAVPIYNNDLIRLGDDSQGVLESKEKASVKIGSNAILKVRPWEDNSSRGFLSLLYGKIKASISGLRENESFNVKTANSIIGVKGTSYAGGVDDEGNSFTWTQSDYVYLTDLLNQEQMIVPEGYYATDFYNQGLQQMVKVASDVPKDSIESRPKDIPDGKKGTLDKWFIPRKDVGSVSQLLPQGAQDAGGPGKQAVNNSRSSGLSLITLSTSLR